MKRAILAFTLTLTACATAPQPTRVSLAQARIAYNSTCGEVLRLAQAGKDLPAAQRGCVTANTALDAADVAYAAGQLAEAQDGAQRAMVYITAAQALIAASGAVK